MVRRVRAVRGSTYRWPLLGSPWTASYALGDDRRSLAGARVCDWAQADEWASRDGREA
jgi:hypothetical protein